jgi:Druantia protein DruA
MLSTAVGTSKSEHKEKKRRAFKSKVTPLLLENRIRHVLHEHFQRLGLRKNGDGTLELPQDEKTFFRELHRFQRAERLMQAKAFVQENWPKLQRYFADGADVAVSRITPRLELVEAGTWQSELFRLATLTWSVPVSGGYGRRLRFLVWDETNGKLIGIIGLGDPVFNLRARDTLIGWTAKDRQDRLVNAMDAYVLGALPPYSFLLGGKLIACLLRTKEIRDAFKQRYGQSRGVISRKRKHPELSILTTTSALGRSSVYNRLTLDGLAYFRSIGYTSGWGHFHVPQSVFDLVRQLLRARRDPYAGNNRFGDGPNWRLRALRQGLSLVGLNPDVLWHGVGREVFLCELACNAKSFLTGRAHRPRYTGLRSVKEVGELARRRWIEPRAERCPGYRQWSKESILQTLAPTAECPRALVSEPASFSAAGSVESRKVMSVAYVAR